MKEKKSISILLLILCTAIWGTTFTVVKDVSTKIDPFLLSTIRSWIAAIVFLGWILLRGKMQDLKDKRAIRHGFILGLVISSIYIIQTIGLKFTSSTHSAFITSSSIIMVPFLLALMGKNKINARQIVTVLIVTTGLYFLTNSKAEGGYNQGDLLTLLGALICAINIILSGLYVKKSTLYGFIFYQFFFAAVLSSLALGTKAIYNSEKILFMYDAVPSVIYLSIMGTLVCYFIMTWVQQHLSTILTAMILSVEPIFATTASYLYIGEIITSLEILGALLILTGIIYYNLRNNKESETTSSCN